MKSHILNDNKMTTAQIIANEKLRKLNVEINNHLRTLKVIDCKGKFIKTIHDVEDSEFKQWVLARMEIRDSYFN